MAFWSNASGSGAAVPARKYRFTAGPQGTNWWYVNTVTLPSFEINTSEYQLLNQKYKVPGVPTWSDVTINIVDVKESIDSIIKILNVQSTMSESGAGQEDGVVKYLETRVRANLRTAEATSAAKKIQDFNSSQEMQKNEGRDSLLGSTYIEELRKTDPSFKTAAEQKAEFAAAVEEASKLKIKNAVPTDANDFQITQLNDDGKAFRTWTLVNSFIKSINYGDLDYSSDDLVSIEIVVGYDYATFTRI